MWDSLRMNKGEGLLSWNLFYFGPAEDWSDISIECVAPVSSCRLHLSRWTQRAAELRRAGGCTPQSCPRTGVRVHQHLLLSCPLLPAHFPGRKPRVHPWQGLQHALFCSSAPPSMGVSALLSGSCHTDFKVRDREDPFELVACCSGGS